MLDPAPWRFSLPNAAQCCLPTPAESAIDADSPSARSSSSESPLAPRHSGGQQQQQKGFSTTLDKAETEARSAACATSLGHAHLWFVAGCQSDGKCWIRILSIWRVRTDAGSAPETLAHAGATRCSAVLQGHPGPLCRAAAARFGYGLDHDPPQHARGLCGEWSKRSAWVLQFTINTPPSWCRLPLLLCCPCA